MVLFRPWVNCGTKWKIELTNFVLGGHPRVAHMFLYQSQMRNLVQKKILQHLYYQIDISMQHRPLISKS